MQYSPESPEIELRPQIKILFQRLATIYKQFENEAREINSMGGDKYKIGSTIFSMVVTSSKNDKNQPHLTVIANNIKMKKGILAELANIYDRPKV